MCSHRDNPCVAWCGLSRSIPVLLFFPEAAVSKDGRISSTGERYHMAFKIVRTESRLVRGILANHGFREVHQNSNDFNLMWSGSHLKPYMLRNLQDFQKVNHFPRSYELTRKDRLYKNIQRMQQAHGFKDFHIVPQTFVLPYEYQEFCNSFAKDRGPWIIKPVASSRGRGIYLVSNPTQISVDDNILVSRYINNPLLIDEFKFDVRLYVLVTSYDPLLIYVYEEGLARFATVKYDQTSKNIKNTFMHLTNYSVNKKSSDYVSCDDPEVEDYGNKWSMSAVLRYLKQEGKDTTLLMRQVEDLIIKAIMGAEQQIATACKTFVPHKTNCFELYGFDVLIDANLKPWLLEVNLSPSLACDAPLDLKIKASMIADMFSLVGFVCQDPLSRQSRSERVTLEPSLKHPAAQRTQVLERPLSEPTAAKNGRVAGSKDKLAVKQESTLSLTAEEIKVLRRIQEEYERRGGFIRIFPTAETWELYGEYLESKTSMNYTVANRLFHGRNVSGNVQLQVESFHDCHVIQYERKLLTLETHKRRRHRLTSRSAAGKRKSGSSQNLFQKCLSESKTSLTLSGSQEAEECAQEEREEVKAVLEPLSKRALEAELSKQMAASLKRCQAEALSSSEAAAHNGGHKVSLLDVLQQGWDLSKVQARKAFSSYLQRVQQRLLAESRTDAIPAWPDKDNDQMDLVIRFLKRAASNLQQDIQVAFPSRQLPLQDRRRILSHQLGEFIHCYDQVFALPAKQQFKQETENIVKKQVSDGGLCVNAGVFQEYISAASEAELEEVLTFYTQKNKSSTVFLGAQGNVSGNSESSKNAEAAVRQPSDRQEAVTTQPEIQAPQHRSSFPATIDSADIQQHRRSASSATLPLYCLPPPPPPPQLPSYAQSLAKSQFCYSERPPDPPAYASSAVVSQPLGVSWTPVSTGKNPPNQVLRRIQSFTSSMSCGGASSLPRTMQLYSQKLSRPTSTIHGTTGCSRSALDVGQTICAGELHPRPEPTQSNQQAFLSALQKLADKQAARRYASSSHINLLTHHLTQMNLANRMLSRDGFALNPPVQRTAAPAAQRPEEGVRSGTQQAKAPNSDCRVHVCLPTNRPQKDRDDAFKGQTQSPYSLLTPMTPQQIKPPAPGSDQLQSAIKKLQQQSLRSRQFLDQSHRGQQALF
uniref:Tubulin--tyrosine ligase-like protein 5 n=1 Tax=Tetraodon nigroviridis TaxID=99883 RepID=H3DJ54_TETNG